jgi:beta-glucosidase
MSEWLDNVPAIIQGWYAGSEAGNVFAEIIFGDINPSGKLPFTFPKKLEDSPAHKIGDYPGENSQVEYKEGVFVGYRYFDTFNVEPQFAFGHGLSYTDFSYNDLNMNAPKIFQGKDLELSVKIKNVGNVSGKEVIQLYIEDLEARLKRPKKELKNFQKIHLDVGEEKEVIFKINEKMFSFYDVEVNDWKAEPGKFRIHIGSASDDIRLSEIIEYAVAENKN